MIAITTTSALMEELNKTLQGKLSNDQLVVDETRFSKTDVKRLLLNVSRNASEEIQMITRELGTEIALGFTNGRMVMKHRTTYDLHPANEGDYLAVQETTEQPAAEDSYVVVDIDTPFDNPAEEVVEPRDPYPEYELEDEEEQPSEAAPEAPVSDPAPAETAEPEKADEPAGETVVEAPKAEEAPAEEPAPAEEKPEPDKTETPEETPEDAPAEEPKPETIEMDLGEMNYADAKAEFANRIKGKPFGSKVKLKIKKDGTVGNSLTSWSWVLAGKEFNVKKTAIREEGEYIYAEYTLEKPTPIEKNDEKPAQKYEKAKEHKRPPIREVPKTTFTAEDAIEKLDKETTTIQELAGPDAKWVVERLKELCKEDNDLVQYIMQPHKNFEDAFTYVFNIAKKRECGMIMNEAGGYNVVLSKEDSIEFFKEYYMYDEDEVKRLKDEEEAAKKAKAEEAKAKTATGKKTKGKSGKAAKPAKAEAKDTVPVFDQIEKAKAEAAPEPAPKAEPAPDPAPVAEVKPCEPVPAKKPAKVSEAQSNQVSIFDLLLA